MLRGIFGVSIVEKSVPSAKSTLSGQKESNLMVLNVGQRQSATQIGRDHDSFIGMKVQGMILFSHLTDLAGLQAGLIG